MIEFFGKQLHTVRLILFLAGIVVGVSVDFFIKTQIEEHWARPWSSDLVVQENEHLVVFNNDPKKTRLLVKETTVIENFWSLVYVRNYNIGFSMLGFVDKFLTPSIQTIFFKILQLAGLFFVCVYFFVYGLQYPYTFFLIITGGMGNVIDRWYRGYVVDYMKWYIDGSPIKILDPWPIFNLADSLITVGIFSLLIQVFFFTKKAEKREPKTSVIKSKAGDNNHE